MICFDCNKEYHQWECPKKIRNQEIASESHFSFSNGFRKDKQSIQKYKTNKIQKVQHSESEASEANSSLGDESHRYSVESVTKSVYSAKTVHNTSKKTSSDA